jgi:AFG3 family protein
MPGDKPYSDSTAEAMDEEARKIVDVAYTNTVNLIREKKDEVEKVAKLLLDKETITHDDIIDLVGPRPFTGNEAYQEYVSKRFVKEKEAEENEEDEVEESDKIEDSNGLNPGLAFKV